MKAQLGCMGLCYEMNVWLVESLWVTNRGEAGKGDIVVPCCYKLPGQGEEVDSDFFNSPMFLVTDTGSHWG